MKFHLTSIVLLWLFSSMVFAELTKNQKESWYATGVQSGYKLGAEEAYKAILRGSFDTESEFTGMYQKCQVSGWISKYLKKMAELEMSYGDQQPPEYFEYFYSVRTLSLMKIGYCDELSEFGRAGLDKNRYKSVFKGLDQSS
tara:strand:- start:172 stop:597 length:426 start_codon:yes stop_codon:yes gene_type:complete